MGRTNSAAVVGILGPNYNQATNLQPFIDSAATITNWVATCAANKGIPHSDAELEIIERWLSGHFYAQMDQMYQSKGTGGANASFQGQTGLNLDNTKYGQTAQSLDYSGCLTALNKRQFARGVWLGQPCGVLPAAPVPSPPPAYDGGSDWPPA